MPDTTLQSDRNGGTATPILRPPAARGWFDRLRAAVVERGRSFAPIPAISMAPVERAHRLASSLLTERGEASGAAIASELLNVVTSLTVDERAGFYAFLTQNFQPDPLRLTEAAKAYLAQPDPLTTSALAAAAEPPRQEVLRRMNMAHGGTAFLVSMRKELLASAPRESAFNPLDADMRHLFTSWFNRGFLELRRIDWQTPAAILEKLITYEAVHEIQGWDDLRRRLAPDRRCFAFFHPSLPGEPLIFVEVALVTGLAGSMRALLERETNEQTQLNRALAADTAIFYSISNCQDGLRGISFGNFLIKQVVEELRAELPGLRQFATLSPVPGFRRWIEKAFITDVPPQLPLTGAERDGLHVAAGMATKPDQTLAAVQLLLSHETWFQSEPVAQAVKPALLRLAAFYLTAASGGGWPLDPVARFHLGNGASLRQINWMGNPSKRGMAESFGIMVNYLYDPAMIEANHEAFSRDGTIVSSPEVKTLLAMATTADAKVKPLLFGKSP